MRDAAGLREIWPLLETPRLRMRSLADTDESAIWAYASDPEVARHLLWDTHTSREDCRAFLRQVGEGVLAPVWGLELKEGGTLIGTLGLSRVDPANFTVEVGFALGQPWWGRGLATEAVQAASTWLLDQGVRRLEARVFRENAASARVMEKAGYVEEGRLRRAAWAKGRAWDVRIFARLSEG